VESHETYLALSQRFPQMKLAAETFEYHAILRGRALKKLPVKLK
jgi:hypothetical protein